MGNSNSREHAMQEGCRKVSPNTAGVRNDHPPASSSAHRSQYSISSIVVDETVVKTVTRTVSTSEVGPIISNYESTTSNNDQDKDLEEPSNTSTSSYSSFTSSPSENKFWVCKPPPSKRRNFYYGVMAGSIVFAVTVILLIVFLDKPVKVKHVHPLDIIINVTYYENSTVVTIIPGEDSSTPNIISDDHSLSPSPFKQYSFDHLAVCNDGSQPGYYYNFYSEGGDDTLHLHFTPQDGGMSNYSAGFVNTSFKKWVIFLMWGGQCWSQSTCDGRDSSLMSSRGLGPTAGMGGIFDRNPSNNKAFHDANQILIPYCSSDGWMGDAEASPVTWGYHMRGSRIIASIINDLIHSGAITSSSQILFGGASAGGRGAMMNVDNVARMLPVGATMLGALLDSPYYLDMEPNGGGFEGFPYAHKEIYDRFNVSAVIPLNCAVTYGVGSEWKCLMGQYRMPFVHSPYVVVAAQFDSYQVGMNNLGGNSSALELFSEKTKRYLRELYHIPRRNRNSKIILSWSCFNHAESLGGGFSSGRVVSDVPLADGSFPTMSIEGAVALLYSDRGKGGSQIWLDNCTASDGQACGGKC